MLEAFFIEDKSDEVVGLLISDPPDVVDVELDVELVLGDLVGTPTNGNLPGFVGGIAVVDGEAVVGVFSRAEAFLEENLDCHGLVLEFFRVGSDTGRDFHVGNDELAIHHERPEVGRESAEADGHIGVELSSQSSDETLIA